MNRYDPNTNIPGYVPPAPQIQQGQPLNGFAMSLAGVSQEDLRQEMMRRTGQYGPIPRHRVRGAIGGQNITLHINTAAAGQVVDVHGGWQTLLRDDKWTEDATGPHNASFKTIVTLGSPGPLYAAGIKGVPLGMIVRLSFGVGGTTNNQLIFDVPTNGMVHVPFCGETVIAEVATERKVVDSTFGWIPDAPILTSVNLANSALVRAPEVSGAIVIGQGLTSSFVNNATREIAYLLAGGGDSAVVPIPRGSQAVRVVGMPADLVVTQATPSDSGTPDVLPIVQDTIEPLFSTCKGINISSAADGGLVALWFYLGI